VAQQCRICTSIEELPQGIDLAVILTAASTVPDLTDAYGRQGIRKVVIESRGFGEFSAEGQELSERLRAVARKWGIRFVGPNCISVINIVSGVCLPFARLQRDTLKKGRVSVVSQSGGITIVYTGLLSSVGLGISKAVSMGNKLDLDETDYLAYLLANEDTDIICLLERKGAHRLAHAVREWAARYNRHCCGTGNRSPCAPSPKARKSSPSRKPWSILPSAKLTRPWRPWPPPGTATADSRRQGKSPFSSPQPPHRTGKGGVGR
jgi:succinyl-CoA synthetase alpha subunit